MKKVATKYTIYLIIGIITVFAVIVGGTYAIFRKTTIQNSTNIISTLDCLNISITGNNSALSLNNAYPLKDNEGVKQTPYRFTVKNNCDTYVEYQIVMSVVNTSNITNKEYVKIDIDGIKSNRNKKISELIEEPQQGLPGYLNNYTLINNSFVGNESHVYNFRMWLNGENEAIWNDNTIANQSLNVKLSIIGVTKTQTGEPTLKDKILAQEGGPEAIEAKGNPDFSKIAVSQSTYDGLPETGAWNAAIKSKAVVENGIYATEDEYGTSYYYRGEKNLLNNNLIFGGFQWKIIRINGDGSVRIIYNGTEAEFNSSGTMNTTGTSTQIGTGAWNAENYGDVKYMGYMYGGANGVSSTQRHGSTSAAATYNETSTHTKIQLENWYQTNIVGKSFENQILDNLYCNDRQLQNEVGGPPTGSGYGSNDDVWYAALYRLYTIKTPTLKCGLKNDRFTKNDLNIGNGALTYPVGLISADEAAMAGLAYNVIHQTSYLNTNQWFRSFTPSDFNGGSGDPTMFGITVDGFIGHYDVTSSGGLRPVLNISSDITVIGDGSATNPYKVGNSVLKDEILAQEGGPAAIEAKGAPNFAAIATAADTGLYASQDEYGTSFYYRGVRENLKNNLIFGGFQWKIVRINGDGSVRIMYNGTEEQFTQSGTMNTTGASTSINGTTYAWNETSYNDAKYVGYMYGGNNGMASTSRNGSISTAATYNQTNSNAKTTLDTWYQTNIAGKSFENKIVDNLFCNDRQLQSEVGGVATGPGYGSSETFYAANYRLNTNKIPTLKCGQKNDRFTKNDILLGNGVLTHPVGLISADEVAMAGLVYGAINGINYLYTSQHYWTSTSFRLNSAGTANVHSVHSSGRLVDYVVDSTLGLRAVINLNPNVAVTGDGSATNPYRVV